MIESRPSTAVIESGSHHPSRFVATHWSLVVQAAESGTEGGRKALAELCRVYWYPLYGFARRRGHPESDAKDLTQGFFAKLLADGSVARAEASRGRFRTYLLAMFEHYRSHEFHRSRRLKRGGGCEIVSLDWLADAESHFQAEPSTADSPERLFDRKWAVSLIESALEAVRREYDAAGKLNLFDVLNATLWGERPTVTYAQIARGLNSTEGAIKLAAFRLRQRVQAQLRIAVARTVVRPEDAEDELRHLFSALDA